MKKIISHIGFKKIIGFVLFFFLIIVLSFGLSNFLKKKTEKPRINYGEFPFKIVYEINGEQTTIEDTLIIRYNGMVYSAETFSYSIQWTRLYKSELDIKNEIPDYSDDVFLILLSEDIYFDLGSSEYYMGMPETEPKLANPGEIFHYPSLTPLSNEELYEKYGIKIIEKYISPPITEQAAD